jgi:imidazole glycerol-phosphate synthase subunit HisF
MLKFRVIPTLLIRDVNLVKGPAFNSWRSVGAPMQAMKVFNRRDVDEIILLDIAATANGRDPDFATFGTLAQECFVPLTLGGGVRTLDHVRMLLRIGADKVAINSAAYDDPELIRSASNEFGSQCVVAGIDFVRHDTGDLDCVGRCGNQAMGRDPVVWARELERLGAGEILLTSVQRDGLMCGYDLAAIKAVAEAVSIPVIASGGAANYDDFAHAIQDAQASAVSAASMYLFTQATPLEAKAHLASIGIPVRKQYKG